MEKLPATISGEIIDLGTGNGLFAKLLQNRYPDKSIWQIDLRSFDPISGLGLRAAIQSLPFRQGSFAILLGAQVLHYVPHEHQEGTINSLLDILEDQGILVIIEYQTNRSYSWLPYPVTISQLQSYDTIVPIRQIIRDNDQQRPKFAAYFIRSD